MAVMWTGKIYLVEVRLMLRQAGIPFVQKDYPNEREYLQAYFRQPNLKGRSAEPVSVLQVEGGNEKTPVWIEFLPGEEGMVLCDLYFGEYAFELFQNSDEVIRQTLTGTIRDILSGKIRVITSWTSKSIAWNGDQCFYIAPGEEEDDSAEYATALRKIEKPRGWFSQHFGTETTYAVYNWTAYREITR